MRHLYFRNKYINKHINIPKKSYLTSFSGHYCIIIVTHWLERVNDSPAKAGVTAIQLGSSMKRVSSQMVITVTRPVDPRS